jgi:hypothetical protein
MAWLESEGIECLGMMTDTGHAYDSKAFAKACHTLCHRHICTRTYTHRTKGKAGRLIQPPAEGAGLRHGLPEL